MTEQDKVLMIERIEKELVTKTRRALVAMTTECLGSQGITFLSALGVDANKKLLQIFKQEATQLLSPHKEDADAK